jgi:O-antigen/teichoic acid export membrane protein
MASYMPGTEDRKVHWRRLRSNMAAVVLARLVVPLLNVALVVLIARSGGAASLGEYTFLISLFVLLEQLKSFGLPMLIVRDVARDESSALSKHASLVRLGVYGAVAGVPILTGVAMCSGMASFDLLIAALCISLGLFPSAYIVANDSLFLAIGRASLSTSVALVENTARLVLSLSAVSLFDGGLIALAVIYAVTRLGAAAAQAWLIHFRLNLALAPEDKRISRALLRQAPAALAIYVAPIVLFRMDIVVLGIFGTPSDTGVYSAAARLISTAMIVPDGLLTATFVTMSRFSGHGDLDGFSLLFSRTLQLISFGLVPATIIGVWVAPTAISLLYGDRWSTSVAVLRILIWTLAPFALARAMGDALVALGRQAEVARIILATTAVTVPAYVFLIHQLGAVGAAWGFVFSAAFICTLCLRACSRERTLARLTPVSETFAPWLICLALQQVSDSLGSLAISSATSIVSILALVSAALFRRRVTFPHCTAPGPTVARVEESTV